MTDNEYIDPDKVIVVWTELGSGEEMEKFRTPVIVPDEVRDCCTRTMEIIYEGIDKDHANMRSMYRE